MSSNTAPTQLGIVSTDSVLNPVAIQRPIVRGRLLFTKAEEAVPWQIPELRELSLSAMGLLYVLNHGPRSGRCLNATTLGVCLTSSHELAGLTGSTVEVVEEVLDELLRRGWILFNREKHIIVIPAMIAPADNAKHLQGLISALAEKLPECPETLEYARIVVERTLLASRKWERDGEVVEELLRDVYRLFPELQDDDLFSD